MLRRNRDIDASAWCHVGAVKGCSPVGRGREGGEKSSLGPRLRSLNIQPLAEPERGFSSRERGRTDGGSAANRPFLPFAPSPSRRESCWIASRRKEVSPLSWSCTKYTHTAEGKERRNARAKERLTAGAAGHFFLLLFSPSFSPLASRSIRIVRSPSSFPFSTETEYSALSLPSVLRFYLSLARARGYYIPLGIISRSHIEAGWRARRSSSFTCRRRSSGNGRASGSSSGTPRRDSSWGAQAPVGVSFSFFLTIYIVLSLPEVLCVSYLYYAFCVTLSRGTL